LQEWNGLIATVRSAGPAPEVGHSREVCPVVQEQVPPVENPGHGFRRYTGGLMEYHEGTTFARVLIWGLNAILLNYSLNENLEMKTNATSIKRGSWLE
jgi:hypothetical protein